MSTAKHTPAPWPEAIIEQEYGKPQFSAMLPGIGTLKFIFLMHPAECQANAAFIVRACNSHEALLNACRMALQHYEPGITSSDVANVRILREAITKAEGKA